MTAINENAARILRNVKQAILDEPLRLNMLVWAEKPTYPGELQPFDSNHRQEPFAPCGTAACIAGWTVILEMKNPPPDCNYYMAAGQLLGLGLQESNQLFLPGQWPFRYYQRYKDAANPKEKALVAAERIEYFIATGE